MTIFDHDPALSLNFNSDAIETITIGTTTYANPQAGTYELTLTDSDGTTHTEDPLLFATGANFIFVPLPNSSFDTGSMVTSLGGASSSKPRALRETL